VLIKTYKYNAGSWLGAYRTPLRFNFNPGAAFEAAHQFSYLLPMCYIIYKLHAVTPAIWQHAHCKQDLCTSFAFAPPCIVIRKQKVKAKWITAFSQFIETINFRKD
jgi:hypothetical protein